jgi:hypothetical protein
VALWSGNRLPSFAPAIVLFWCGALLASLWYPLMAAGVVAGVLAKAGSERGLPVARWTTLGSLATGVALTVAEDIHGAALLESLLTLSLRRPVPA